MKKRWIIRLSVIALFLLIVIAGFGQAVLQLWNLLMPPIFGLRQISFWQAVGLMGLSWILFGGLGMFRGRPLPYWRHRVAQRMEHLSPEERERLLLLMERRCGHADARPSDSKA